MSLERKQKIALFISSFRAGGGEKQMVEIANVLARQGTPVDLLVIKPVGPLAENIASEVRVVSLDQGRILFSLFPLIRYFWKERPQVLLALDEYTHLLALAARFVARTKTRTVLRVGNMLSELALRYTGKAKILRSLVRRYYRYADAVIANSRGVADDVVRVTGVDPKRVTVIYNPKPVTEIAAKATLPTGHSWLDTKTIPVIVAVGRLREQKNFAFLIETFASFSKEHSSRLVIVGAGREEERLRKLIQERACEDKVLLAGYTDNPYAYMARGDIFVSVSLWEGLPNGVMEAMACGVAIIASDCSSGPRELLAPETEYAKRLSCGIEQVSCGVLTAVNDREALMEALTFMLGNPAAREKFAHAARARAADFDSGKSVDAYVRVLSV